MFLVGKLSLMKIICQAIFNAILIKCRYYFMNDVHNPGGRILSALPVLVQIQVWQGPTDKTDIARWIPWRRQSADLSNP